MNDGMDGWWGGMGGEEEEEEGDVRDEIWRGMVLNKGGMREGRRGREDMDEGDGDLCTKQNLQLQKKNFFIKT